MKKNSFTTGVLIGVLSVIIVFFITGFKSNSVENINRYEFYDLKDTRGIVFDKSTGEIVYTEIRKESLSEYTEISGELSVDLSGDINTTVY